MNYISYVNASIHSAVAGKSPLVMFGQNVSAGSCIGGLTKGLKNSDGQLVLNTPNCENTLVGTGFGLMLGGVSSIFFMKQQDFLLLGIDQLVNTYNLIRRREARCSFTIVNVVVDSGYEGPQSSLNNFYDFCSVARIPGYAATNRHDVEFIFRRHLTSPGFRIIGVSQRLCRQDLLDAGDGVSHDENGDIFRYRCGKDLTIACFNFSFPQGLTLAEGLKKQGIEASLFSVNAMLPVDWKPILESCRTTRNFLVLDDAKSVNRTSQHLVISAQRAIDPSRVLFLFRESGDEGLGPNADAFVPDQEQVMGWLKGRA